MTYPNVPGPWGRYPGPYATGQRVRIKHAASVIHVPEYMLGTEVGLLRWDGNDWLFRAWDLIWALNGCETADGGAKYFEPVTTAEDQP